MAYYEFVCLGTPSMLVATADADPERIPDAAKACCREWQFVREFRFGDGSHGLALEETIRQRVASQGYHIFSRSGLTGP